MRLEIQCQGVELSDEDRGQVARRFRFALGRFATKVKRVAIYFGFRSGPWGGIGQSCRVVVSLPPRKPLAIEVLERDRAAAVDRAADRAGLAVQRALESQRVEERDRQVRGLSSRRQASRPAGDAESTGDGTGQGRVTRPSPRSGEA